MNAAIFAAFFVKRLRLYTPENMVERCHGKEKTMAVKLKDTVADSVLGQKVSYPTRYDRTLLFPVERARQRESMQMPKSLVMNGFDLWNAYELFWLNEKGKPVRSCATFVIPADSVNLAESKSVKLYLNSLNHERFKHSDDVAHVISRDLFEICQTPITVMIAPSSLGYIDQSFYDNRYVCLDDLDVTISHYDRTPSLLRADSSLVVEERLVSHLFKSHCLCTGQPDLGSIFIEYTGSRIEHESLLAYLISYRDHVGFSENCIEQIFFDLIDRIQPQKLLVYGRFTRRGGIDINPYRANFQVSFHNARMIYQ